VAVTQHFTFELDVPTLVIGDEVAQVTLTRPDAESLYEELGEALYPGGLATQQGPTPGFLEAVIAANAPPFEETEDSKSPEEILAFLQASAAAEMHREHTADPNQPRGSAIGTRHVN